LRFVYQGVRDEDPEEYACGGSVSVAGWECRYRVRSVWTGLPYQQQNEPTDNAAHWGYQDGFHDGSHDRATGGSSHARAITNMPRVRASTDSRDEYKNIYREAYVHGYEKGYGR
jgi:hypothetical protein